MSTSAHLSLLGGSSRPVRLDFSEGHVIWWGVAEPFSLSSGGEFDVVTEVDELVQQIRRVLPSPSLTIVAVWPDEDPTGTRLTSARLLTDIAVGVAQSLQLELGSGIRSNVIIARENQQPDMQRTIQYFHGPDGGFVAGCSFDLRSKSMERAA